MALSGAGKNNQAERAKIFATTATSGATPGFFTNKALVKTGAGKKEKANNEIKIDHHNRRVRCPVRYRLDWAGAGPVGEK